MNDPLGDMLTRIRNAQMRRRPKTTTPASNMRTRVLEVLKDEGYIRGYAQVEQKGARPEIEIELKYNNGEPAIRTIKRVSQAGPTGLFGSQRHSDGGQWTWRRHPVDSERRDVRLARARRERRRRGVVQRVLMMMPVCGIIWSE